MTLTLDPLDFPMIGLPKLGLAVHLLPVSKVQFEYFLGEAPDLRQQFDLNAYPQMTAINPRSSWRAATGRSERLFVTAILPTEVDAYARWLGRDFRMPTDMEWRAIDAALAGPAPRETLETLTANARVHPAARAIVAAARAANATPLWRELGLFEHGLLEWVRARDGYRLHGRVRPELHRVIHNPQVHDALRLQVDPAPRHKAFGFRLVKPFASGGRP